MNTLYIWGAGRQGEKFYYRITGYLNHNCRVIFCDSDEQKAAQTFCGLPVIGPEAFSEMVKKDDNYIVVMATGKSCYDDIKALLRGKGIENRIYGIEELKNRTDELLLYLGKPVLPYLETHVCDHCNLNCRGCGHLSNIAPVKFADPDIFARDLNRLRELFADVTEWRLMGGEPFLNEHLADYAKAVRETFPNTDLRVVTNGLLLNSDKYDILKVLRESDVRVDVTEYKPTGKKKKEISEVLNKSEIRFFFTEEASEFMRFRHPDARQNPEDAYRKCPIKKCHFLREGFIANCSFPVLYSELDTKMKDMFCIEEEDKINIHDEQSDGWSIVLQISAPIPCCRYCCTDRIEWFPWDAGHRNANVDHTDWFIKTGEDKHGIKN